MAEREYDIVWAEAAAQQLRDIRDTQARRAIGNKVNDLKTDPELRGKALVDELAGYYRLVAAGRYRAIYRIISEPIPPRNPGDPPQNGKVGIACVGIRKDGDKKDVYAIARRMLARGELKAE